MRARLGIVVSHPTQYYSPWFRQIAATSGLDIRVFYLWDSGVVERVDEKFEHRFAWDIPLLDGYEYELLSNVAQEPGTHHFGGLDNPGLLPAVKAFEPDALLVFGYAWKSMLSLIWRRSRGIPVLLRGDSHRLVPETVSLSKFFKRSLTRATFRQCQGFLAVGMANRAFYLGHGVDEGHVYDVPHCVDNDRFQCGESKAVAATASGVEEQASFRTKIVFVGKLERKKRPDLLVDAFTRASNLDAELWVVGAGPMKAKLERMAGDDERVQFLGFQNQSKLPALYQAADVIVLPSEGPSETWGLVVNEAMNHGCVPIVSDHVGCHLDLVRPGENGWVFQAGSVDALSACLREVVENPVRAKRFSARSVEIIEGFSYAAATSGLVKAFDCVTA